MKPQEIIPVGALYETGTCHFSLWAPLRKQVSLVLESVRKTTFPMELGGDGYWRLTLDSLPAGARYKYLLDDGGEYPDPASRRQPEGVHGASAILDPHAFRWSDESWKGIPLAALIIYELHVGTFTPQGTFGSVMDKLHYLKRLGVNAIEIMPVAQFPGSRNWGYDGVFPYAAQNSYGGSDGLKTLVNACHEQGIAVILDVVYNHLGHEGNYLGQYAPYFTEKYKTPWGKAFNFDDAYSDGVRNYFVGNALYWLRDHHIDALRLDAVHAIYDFSATPFLLELAEAVMAFSFKEKRERYLIAESDLSDVRIIAPPEEGGYGLDAQWLDDYHHALRVLLTGDRTGYYEDFGKIGDLVQAMKEGYVFPWKYSSFRKRHHGNSSKGRPADQFVVFSQNHDQVGNRMLGERLTTIVSHEALKLAAGAVLLSPHLPMLFMGEEYGEEHPFLFFVDYSDAKSIEGVRQGRKEEFKAFAWKGEPPDPQSEETFHRSRLDWAEVGHGWHHSLYEFYRTLIDCRTSIPALKSLDNKTMDVEGSEEERTIIVHRWHGDDHILLILNFKEINGRILLDFDSCRGKWQKVIDSADDQWQGPGTQVPGVLTLPGELSLQPLSFLLYRRITPPV